VDGRDKPGHDESFAQVAGVASSTAADGYPTNWQAAEAERTSPSNSWRRNFQIAAAVKDAPFWRAAARRSPQAILDSRSGLEKWALQELDGEVRSSGGGARRKSAIVHLSP
jgi:hypothetical protein